MSSETFYVNEINRDYVEGRREYPIVASGGASFIFYLFCIFIGVAIISALREGISFTLTPTSIAISCVVLIFIYGMWMSVIEGQKIQDKWKSLALTKKTKILDAEVRFRNSYSKSGSEQSAHYEFVSPKTNKVIDDWVGIAPGSTLYKQNLPNSQHQGKVIYYNDDTYALL
jgi:hypothetical protein